MNIHEERAWKILVKLGAKEFMLGFKHAIDLSLIRVTSRNKLCLFVQAVLDVVGRSGTNRRHVDRRGFPVYIVTDCYTVGQPHHGRHDAEAAELPTQSRANNGDHS